MQYHGHIFGEIKNGRMNFNEAGIMVEKWWNELTNKYPQLKLDEYQIMPNHLHGIINVQNVGADPRVCPKKTLGQIIQWFKTMSTNEYIRGVRNNNWEPFPKHLWQRNYFERIIRNEEELFSIRNYIKSNPKNWGHDIENK